MASRAPLILGGIAFAIGIAAWGLLGGDDGPGERTELGLTTPSQPATAPTADPRTSRLLGLTDRPDLPTRTGRSEVPDTTPSSAAVRPPGPGEARISGWVKVAMRPIGGATISARGPDGASLASAISQADGSWALYLEPGAPFVLRASYPMTVPTERPEPPLAEGDQRRAGNLTLAMGRRVTGTVLDSTAQPIPGAWAAVAGAPATEAMLADSVQSAGSLTLENTPLGATIEVGAPGFVTQILRPVTGEGGATLDVTLEPGRRAEVQVLDPTGQPIPGATVLWVQAHTKDAPSDSRTLELLGTAPKPDSPAARNSFRTDAAGIATATTLGPMDYWAEASHPDFDSSAPTLVPVSQASGGQPSAITMAFRPRVQFLVVDTLTGAPLPGAVAFCQDERGSKIPCTPQAGAVDTVTSTEGPHQAFAWAPGYQVGSIEVLAERGPPWSEGSADLLQLALTRAEFQELAVVDEAGLAIPGATLFYGIEPDPAKFGRSHGGSPRQGWDLGTRNATDPLQLQIPGDGDWPTLVLRAPGLQTRTITKDNWPSDSGELSITLYQSTEALITVVDALGEPALGAQIYVTLQGTAMPAPFRTDSRGQALIQGLSPGGASAMARGPGGNLTGRVEFELEANRQAELTLTLR